MKRMLARALRLGGILLALALVLSAALVSLGQYYFPLLGEHRAEVLARIAPLLPFGLEIEHLNAEWTGLAPTFYVEGLRLFGKDDPSLTILSSAHSEIRIDIFRSLLSLAPRVRKLTAENAELGFVEGADGRWRLAGARGSRAPSNPNAIIAFFLAIEEIDLRDVRMAVDLRTGTRLETHGASLLLENYRRFRRLSVDAQDLPGGGGLKFVMESHGDPRLPWRFDAAAYAQLDAVQLKFLTPMLGARIALPEASVSGRLWASVRPGGGIRVQGNLSSAVVKLDRLLPGRKLEAVRDAALSFAADIDDNAVSAWVDGINFDWYNRHVALDRLRLELGAGPKRRLSLSADYIDIGTVAALMRSASLLQGQWAEALHDLDPYGGLANARFEMTLRAPKPLDFLFRARLIDLSASPWRDAPGVRNAAGYAEFGQRTGFVDITSGAVTLEFPHVYHEDIDLDAVTGRVGWQRSETGVQVQSRLLTIKDGDSDLHAAFNLRFFRDPTLDDRFSLSVGLRNGNVALMHKYLPYHTDPGLQKWLDSSIEGGVVERGSLAYHASFSRPGHDGWYAFQLALDVHDGNLTYDPQWPPINDFSGHVLVDGPRVSVWSTSARVLGSQLSEGRVVFDSVQGQRRLKVHARVKGDTADGLQLINDSPIVAFTGGALADWRAQGELQAMLDLDIPFGKPLDARDATVNVLADVGATSLSLGRFDLSLQNVRGPLAYDLKNGLRSSGINAVLWGKPLRATITGDDDGMIRIEADGSAAASDVAGWLHFDPADLLAGSAGFHVTLQQRKEKGFHTTVVSDLVGVSSLLPPPMDKKSDVPAPLHFESYPRDDVTVMSLDFASFLKASIERDAAGRAIGEIALNAEPRSGGDGLRFTGQIEHTDIGAWIENVQTLVSRNVGGGVKLDRTFRIDDLRVRSGELASASVSALRLDSRWEGDDFVLAFDADLAKGDFRMPEDRSQPYLLHATQLQLQPFLETLIPPRADADGVPTGDTAGPTANGRSTNPGSEERWNKLREAHLPPIRVTIDDLRHGEKELGRWSFNIESVDKALEVSDIDATLPGLRVHGLESGHGGDYRLSWDGQTARSELKAGLDVKDFGAFFESWGYSRVIESSRGRVDVAFAWPGYPVDLKMAEVTGLLDFTLHDGHLTQESSNNPLLRTLGVLSIDQILRRMRLDFKDLYQTGLSFDRFEGAIDLDAGHASTREPVEIKGPSAQIQLTGQSDLRSRTLDADLIMTLPIGSNLPWMAALAGGPAAAAGAFVASRLFEYQIGKFSTALYKVSGSMDEPKLELKKVFEFEEKEKKKDGVPGKESTDKPVTAAGQTVSSSPPSGTVAGGNAEGDAAHGTTSPAPSADTGSKQETDQREPPVAVKEQRGENAP